MTPAKISLLFITTAALFSQSLSVGLKAGLRATADFQYAASSESRRYAIGPSLSLSLPRGFSLECDAIYRRQGYAASNATALYAVSLREAGNVWEFPILAAYRIPVRRLRPFAELGWSSRIMHGQIDTSGSYLSGRGAFTSYASRMPADWPTTHGIVAGGGIQLPAGRLQLIPEVRFTHWNRRAIGGSFPDGPSYGSTQNQLDVFLGIAYRIRKTTR